jgi:hypothetical protein
LQNSIIAKKVAYKKFKNAIQIQTFSLWKYLSLDIFYEERMGFKMVLLGRR